MKIRLLSVLLAVVTLVTAQSLDSVLSNMTEVSDFADYANGSYTHRLFFDNSKNITILAPTNSAFKSLNISSSGCATGNGSELHNALIGARVVYHVLNGMYTTSDLGQVPKYIPSMLNNNSYENVARAQIVKAVRQENGDSIFVGGLGSSAKVTKGDIRFDGGILHVLDSWLRLPQNVSYTLQQTNYPKCLDALERGDILGNVNSTHDITLFVPRDESFNQISSVFKKAKGDFYRNLGDYHVLDGLLYSADWDNRTVTMANNRTAKLSLNNGTGYVNQARLVATDVLLNNGIMHVLDRYV